MNLEHFIAQYIMIERSLQSGDFLVERHSLQTLMVKLDECLAQMLQCLPRVSGFGHQQTIAEAKRKQYVADQLRVAAWTIQHTIRPLTPQAAESKKRFDEATLRKAIVLSNEFQKLPVDASFWSHEQWRKAMVALVSPSSPIASQFRDRPIRPHRRKFIAQRPMQFRSRQ